MNEADLLRELADLQDAQAETMEAQAETMHTAARVLRDLASEVEANTPQDPQDRQEGAERTQ